MINKKTVLIMLAIAVVISLVVVFFSSKPEDFSAFIAVGCAAEDYVQQQDIGYITIKLDNAKSITKVLKVEDKELQKKLQNTNLQDIIGVNMILTIPAEEFKAMNVDARNVNVLNLLYNSYDYDNYISVVNIFLNEE